MNVINVINLYVIIVMNLNTFLSQSFQINECDKCGYVKQFKNAYVIICLYVDDMLIMGTNMDIINETKKMLHSSFDIKDLGPTNVILSDQ